MEEEQTQGTPEEASRKVRWTIVTRYDFPIRRKTVCCGQETKRGESVIIVPILQAGQLKGHSILHRRCLAVIMDAAALDSSDYISRFASLKHEIVASGNAFPDKDKVMKRDK